MNSQKYKSYKFGNLIISKISNELAFLYKGKKKLYSKIIPVGNILSVSRKYLYIISAVIVCGIIFYLYKNINFHSEEVAVTVDSAAKADNSTAINDKLDEDEVQKNALLLSKKTDYSVQKKVEVLQVVEHVVTDGDTISGLAKQFGVSMDTICGSNGLRSYDFIQTGKKLIIPNKDGILHKVVKGENINNIARRYKVPVEKIFVDNDYKNFDFVSIGDVIFVPDAKPLDMMPGFLWPSQDWRITSAFGWRRNPFNGIRQYHQGLDMRSNYQNIRATKSGVVTYTGWLGKYGYLVIIAHPSGWKSLYGHLSRIYVRPGQGVKQGQWIARSGNTGYSTGPHLHFELMKDGVSINPRKYLKK